MTTIETTTGSSAPTVGIPARRTPLLLFGLGLAALAIILFVSLESARMARQTEDALPAADESGDVMLRTAPVPDLYIPPSSPGEQPIATTPSPVLSTPLLPPAQYRAPPTASPMVSRAPAPSAVYEPPVATSYAPTWTGASTPGPAVGLNSEAGERTAPDRIMAGRIRNLSSTVVQGTLIRAVLETALDSTRPGQARALVTRDVRGFDGTRVLVPRGSRLFGDYTSEVAAGQNRMMIRWSRLILPGGISVALDSPVADPLGRAGVRAKVDSHLLTRIGNALIDSSASVGSTLLGRRLGGGNQVIVALPGAVQSGPQVATPQGVTPTLKVRQGERISVFVAHDLDFAEASP